MAVLEQLLGHAHVGGTSTIHLGLHLQPSHWRTCSDDDNPDTPPAAALVY
ncbi:hypothetical protein M2158_003277 [Streptomyces sp. SAI-144]|nr:hypothetical protein [Streptomyces sp. SAI-144]MDH6434800.1 hypothetical protein [Streptomyces sp. SAI-144]